LCQVGSLFFFVNCAVPYPLFLCEKPVCSHYLELKHSDVIQQVVLWRGLET
jgi:hypothetical protein